MRHHEDFARIELDSDGINFVSNTEVRQQIVQYFQTLGYSQIGLDLAGYRSGSLNAGIKQVVKGSQVKRVE